MGERMTQHDEIDEEIDRDMGWTEQSGQPRPVGAGEPPPLQSSALKIVSAILAYPIRVFAAATRTIRRVALFPVISPLGYSKNFDAAGDVVHVKRTWGWRIVDGILTRLLLTPVIVALFLCCIVYANTHPARVIAMSTPESLGVFFNRVNLVSIDNQRLAAWYIPPLTTDEVAFDPESALSQKWPSVVICHGLGAAQDQYLSLARELHDHGFAVLMLDTRGQGDSSAAAVTYGLRERLDVLAGVKYLREIDSMDATKVCVVGHDIGATAALQATALDSSIAAVVADGLWPKFNERARQIFSRPFGGGSISAQWLAPLYTTTFELMVRDQLSQLDPQAVTKSIHTQPVLFIARSGEAYAPVQDVLALATSVSSPHEVLIADEAGRTDSGTVDRGVTDFLMKATKWRGPNARGMDQIQKLMRNRVK